MPGPGRQYGIGIVGCGAIAPVHAQALAALPNARLVAVTDVDRDRAEAFAREFGAVCEPDLDALVARTDIDVVDVCVPSGLHAAVAVPAAEAGKHLIVEKPIDVTLAAADRLLDAAGKAGVGLTVISQRRFDPGYQELRALVDQGRLGRLVLGDAHVKWYRAQEYYDSGEWRGTWAVDGGGALMNQGVHYVDLLRWVMGPVREVTGLCVTQSHNIEVEDVALALLRFESGAVGSLEVTTSAFPGLPERIEVSGTGGTMVIETGKTRVRELVDEADEVGSHGKSVADLFAERPDVAEAGPGPARSAVIGAAAHAAQISDFLSSLDNDALPLVTGEEARASLEVVLAVYQSARRGVPVALPLSP